MDVERTMEFILEQQARNAVEHEKFERGLTSLRKLVQVGMKMLVQLQEGHKDLQKELRDGMRELQAQDTVIKAEIRDLLRAQRKSDERFAKLIALLSRQPTNGRPR